MTAEPIQREIEAFDSMRADLEKHHMGKHVIVRDGKLVGAFDTFDAAAREAVKQFGRGPYLIRKVGAAEVQPLPVGALLQPARAPL